MLQANPPVFMEYQDHDTQVHGDHDDDLGDVKAPVLGGDGVQGDIRQGLVVGHSLVCEGEGGRGEDPVGEEEKERCNAEDSGHESWKTVTEIYELWPYSC